ncbi:MAG: Ig-like domain-containing protein [Clostridia bacterium]|nr:Ig-like domain-containing protein [Clostridia bacterium]
MKRTLIILLVVLLIATIEPEHAADRTVRFESSDPGVVTVDQNGYLNAVGPGTATITVTSGDGFAQATCLVTVTEGMPEPEPEEDDGSSSSSFLLRCF